MSLSAISSAQSYQNRSQQIKTDFQQLGSDLQAGNLSQAQGDFQTLSQDISARQTQIKNSVNQDFTAVGQALQSGNLSDAQNKFATLQQDLQQASRAHHHHQRHHPNGGLPGANSPSAQASDPLAQVFQALASSLQTGNLNGAQQAYSVLQEDLQKFGLGVTAIAASGAAGQSPGGNLNLTV